MYMIAAILEAPANMNLGPKPLDVITGVGKQPGKNCREQKG